MKHRTTLALSAMTVLCLELPLPALLSRKSLKTSSEPGR